MNIFVEKYMDGGSTVVEINDKEFYWFDDRLFEGTCKWYIGKLDDLTTPVNELDVEKISFLNSLKNNYRICKKLKSG
jgi:lysine/ornithine N-monooxygenase